jgi:hypothetical protein
MSIFSQGSAPTHIRAGLFGYLNARIDYSTLLLIIMNICPRSELRTAQKHFQPLIRERR